MFKDLLVTHFVRHSLVVGVLLLAISGLVLRSSFAIHMVSLVLLYTWLAVSLNLYLLVGLVDLGFIAFFAISAYTVLIGTDLNVSVLLLYPLAILVNMVLAGMLAWAGSRSRGDYFAVITLAFGEMIRIVLRNEAEITGGSQGIGLSAKNALSQWLSSPGLAPMMVLAGLSLVVGGAVEYLAYGAHGARAILVREQPELVRVSGQRPFVTRLLMALAGSTIASLAGFYFAYWQGYVSPESFSFWESLAVLAMAFVGAGIVGFPGGILAGVSLIVLVPEVFKQWAEYRMVLFGFSLLLVALLRPEGIFGIDWLGWDDRRRRHTILRFRGPTPLDSVSGSERSQRPSGTFKEVVGQVKVGLSVRDLRARYPASSRWVLNGISFDFLVGKKYALLGFNGSGKTTFFKAVVGSPSLAEVAGCIHTHEEERRGTWRCSSDRPAPSDVGLLFQASALCPRLSVFRHALGLAPKRLFRLFALAQRVGLSLNDLFVPVSNLSQLQRRLGELCLVLLRDPRVLLLDEPVAGMTEEDAAAFFRALEGLESENLVVIFVEHNPNLVRRYADVVVFFSDGVVPVANERVDGAEKLLRAPDGGPILVAGSFDDVVKQPIVESYLGGAAKRTDEKKRVYQSEPKVERRTQVSLTLELMRAGYLPGIVALLDKKLRAVGGRPTIIVGPNGTGKTTLLFSLVRHPSLRFCEARIVFHRGNGHSVDVAKLAPHELVLNGIVFLPSDSPIFPRLSIFENLSVTLPLSKESVMQEASKWCTQAFAEALGWSEEGPPGGARWWRLQARVLSGGQQRVLGVLRSLLLVEAILRRDPDLGVLWVLDEPSSGVQPSTAQAFYRALQSMLESHGDRLVVLAAEQRLDIVTQTLKDYEIVDILHSRVVSS